MDMCGVETSEIQERRDAFKEAAANLDANTPGELGLRLVNWILKDF